MDLWANQRRRIDSSRRRADCPCCAQRHFEFLEGSHAAAATTLCGRNSVQLRPGRDAAVDLPALAARLSPHGDFTATPFLARGTLRNERGPAGPYALTVFADGRAIVHGTDRADVARGLYAKYVGV